MTEEIDAEAGSSSGQPPSPRPQELADRLDELQASDEPVTEQDETGSPPMVQRGGTAFAGDARQEPMDQAGGGQMGG